MLAIANVLVIANVLAIANVLEIAHGDGGPVGRRNDESVRERISDPRVVIEES